VHQAGNRLDAHQSSLLTRLLIRRPGTAAIFSQQRQGEHRLCASACRSFLRAQNIHTAASSEADPRTRRGLPQTGPSPAVAVEWSDCKPTVTYNHPASAATCLSVSARGCCDLVPRLRPPSSTLERRSVGLSSFNGDKSAGLLRFVVNAATGAGSRPPRGLFRTTLRTALTRTVQTHSTKFAVRLRLDQIARAADREW